MQGFLWRRGSWYFAGNGRQNLPACGDALERKSVIQPLSSPPIWGLQSGSAKSIGLVNWIWPRIGRRNMTGKSWLKKESMRARLNVPYWETISPRHPFLGKLFLLMNSMITTQSISARDRG